MIETHYSNGWFRARKRLGELWTQQRAKSAYDHRRLHAVIAGPLDHPCAFIEFNRDYVGVGFLDKQLREYLEYSFQEVTPGRLFLTMATYREYDGDSDQVTKGTTYFFRQDGTVVVEAAEVLTGETTRYETTADVSGNWEDYPAFGKYESLLRTDR